MDYNDDIVAIYEHTELYKKNVLAKAIPIEHSIHVWYQHEPLVLECYHIDPANKPDGFNGYPARDDFKHYQWDKLRTEEAKELRIDGRPAAWRVPFLLDPNYTDPEYGVSHLCHNTECYNWDHHTLELLPVNKGRNGCPGGPHCHHQKKCQRPGPYFDH